jgi:hypothetical protein
MRRHFCPHALRVHRGGLLVHYVIVDSVLHVWNAIGRTEKALTIRFILREKNRRIALAIEELVA